MGTTPAPDSSLDLVAVRERFEETTDFTVAMEEEFAIVDPTSLELVDRYEELRAVASEDEVLADAVTGELIASEIEVRSGRCASFGELEQVVVPFDFRAPY